MKQISEELQMKIFDLLEGNLSDQEKAELLNQIAASADLQREYTLMAKTYLPREEDEKILFADKKLLYRRPGFWVSWSPVARYAAASVALLACAASGWYFLKNQSGKNTDFSAKTKEENRIQNSNKATNPSPEVPAEIRTATFKSGRKTHFNENKIEKENGENQFLSPVKYQDQPNPEVKIPAPEFEEGIAIDNGVNVNTAVNSDSNIAIQQIGPVSTPTKRSLSYRLLHNSRQMLANLQLPDVRFRAEKNMNRSIPTIKMEIKTLKTDVIATLIE